MSSRHTWVTVLLLGFLVISGCGGDDRARGVFNGQAFELNIEDVNCIAGPPSGPAVAGFDGILTAPVYCDVLFRTPGYFGDYLNLTVYDIRQVHSQLGAWMPLGGGVEAYLTMQGVPQPILYGQVRFTEISNVSGNNICSDYQITTGAGGVEGSFCEKLRLGY